MNDLLLWKHDALATFLLCSTTVTDLLAEEEEEQKVIKTDHDE
jgi:hypothetical protein